MAVSGSNFRGLAAYRLASALGDAVYREGAVWPSFERWSIGMQAVRAADSVGANIAEASGRWTEADKRRLLLEHWLLQAHNRGLTRESHDEAVAELARTLNGLIRRPVPN